MITKETKKKMDWGGILIFLIFLIVAYYAISMLVYTLRHQELTQIQIFLKAYDALTWK